MTTRCRPGDRGRDLARTDLRKVLDELRRARIAAGLSLRAVADAVGIDHTRLWRYERGLATPSLGEIAAIGAVEGLDVRLRAFPAGDPLRDAGQLRLLARLRARVHPSLRWQTEVPLPLEGDLRAWDAVVGGTTWTAFIEAETVIDDVQALERRVGLKERDGEAQLVVLLVADTRRNRRAIAAAHHAGALGWLPVRTRQILGALAAPASAPVSGTVFL